MKKIILLLGLMLFMVIAFGGVSQDPIEFTDEELEWIKAHPVVRVAPDINFGPIEYLDSDGEVKGAAIDYFEWFQDHTDIEFEIVIYDNWVEVIEAIKSKEVDMLGAATQTEQRDEYLLFTEPYIAIPNVIITRTDGPSNLVLDDLEGEDVVVLADYAIQDYLEYNYSKINLLPVETLDEGLSLVSFGTRDYMVVSIAQVSYYMKEKAVTNLKVSGDTGYGNELSFAVRDDWSMLRRILNKTLRAMPENEHKRIYSKWVSVEVDQLVSREMIYVIFIAMALILAVLIGIIFFNHILRVRVDERTEMYKIELHDRIKAENELEALNNTLEEKVIRRTEELSLAIEELKRMQQKLVETEKMASLGRVIVGVSHQLNTPIGTSISLVSFLQKKQESLHVELVNGSISKEALIQYLEEMDNATAMVEQELFKTMNFIEHFRELSLDNKLQEKNNVHLLTYIKNIVGVFKNKLKASNIQVDIECPDDLRIDIPVVYLHNIFKNLISNSLQHGFPNKVNGRITIQVTKEENELVLVYIDNGIGIEEKILSSIYEPLFTTSMGNSAGFGLNILYNTVVTALNGSLESSSRIGEGVKFVMRFEV